MLVYFKKHW